MWDDARQMNALALTLAILSVVGLAVAGVAFIVRSVSNVAS